MSDHNQPLQEASGPTPFHRFLGGPDDAILRAEGLLPRHLTICPKPQDAHVKWWTCDCPNSTLIFVCGACGYPLTMIAKAGPFCKHIDFALSQRS